MQTLVLLLAKGFTYLGAIFWWIIPDQRPINLLAYNIRQQPFFEIMLINHIFLGPAQYEITNPPVAPVITLYPLQINIYKS
jgi:hypothetical protein